MCPGDPLGDHRQRPIALAVVFEPVLAHEDGMGVPAPLPHQGRAGLQYSAGIERTSAFLELSCENLQAALNPSPSSRRPRLTQTRPLPVEKRAVPRGCTSLGSAETRRG